MKGGGGSGDVHCPYVRNIYEGILHNGDAHIFEPLADFYHNYVAEQYHVGVVPGMIMEPELPDELVAEAAQFSDIAIVSISRFSGERWDRSDVEFNSDEYQPQLGNVSMPQIVSRVFPDGDFYLTAEEKAMLEKVYRVFPKIVVILNVGGIVDTKWIRDNDTVGAALLAWQGGMEGGTALSNLLFGHTIPSGKLPDTFAGDLIDYPSTKHFHDSPMYVEYTEDIYVGYRYFETIANMDERVIYPFGYGLSYTKFDVQLRSASESEEGITLTVSVQNVGAYSGKEVVQVYASAPQGLLGKARRSLVAFQKTKLLAPGETEILTLMFERYAFASYDDIGKVCKSSYVLEKGTYYFYLGTDVRNASCVNFTITLEQNQVIQTLARRLSPTALPKRLRADGQFEELATGEGNNPNACAFEKMLSGTDNRLAPAVRGEARHYEYNLTPPLQLMDVALGKCTMDDFLAQLSDENLIHLLGGQPNTSVANTCGMGNMREYGIPNIMTTDGPAGVRIDPASGIQTTALPCGTMIAATWNPELAMQVGNAGAEEVKENNLAMWLTPGVNIHRNPQCGRNFEYFSEDPLLSGWIGAAIVRGIQKNGISACVKHFAANNKETNRKHSDSRVSERALREIYLKAFEIIVKTADPWAIMSSYNMINGHRASECKELLEGILREEWNYQGMVTSDWWTRGEHYKEILAGNDIKMPTGFPERVKKALNMGVISRKELARSAARILELILKLD